MNSSETDRQQTLDTAKYAAPPKYGLDAMFAPGSVAVIGATDRPGTVGRTVLENLLHGFQGAVYAVNTKHEEVLGLKAYRNIRDIPRPVDLDGVRRLLPDDSKGCAFFCTPFPLKMFNGTQPGSTIWGKARPCRDRYS